MNHKLMLNTGIYIHGTTDVDALYNFALDALLTAENQGRTTRNLDILNRRAEIPYRPGVWVKGVNAEQPDSNPLPASLGLWYRKDGSPVMTKVQAEQEWARCKNGCERDVHAPSHHLLLGFSVSMFWDDEQRNWNPGDMAAALLVTIGTWLDINGVKWTWRNELISEYATGYDGVDDFHSKVVDRREELAGDFFSGLGGAGMMILNMLNLFRDDDD